MTLPMQWKTDAQSVRYSLDRIYDFLKTNAPIANLNLTDLFLCLGALDFYLERDGIKSKKGLNVCKEITPSGKSSKKKTKPITSSSEFSTPKRKQKTTSKKK